MAQQFYQIRYYGDGDIEEKDTFNLDKNYPPRPPKLKEEDEDIKFSTTITNLVNGENILGTNKISNYIKIYTVPGVKLILNKGIHSLEADEDYLLNAEVLIGSNGIYELDLSDYFGIKSICFNNLNLINNKQNESYLIINFICDDANKDTT